MNEIPAPADRESQIAKIFFTQSNQPLAAHPGPPPPQNAWSPRLSCNREVRRAREGSAVNPGAGDKSFRFSRVCASNRDTAAKADFAKPVGTGSRLRWRCVAGRKTTGLNKTEASLRRLASTGRRSQTPPQNPALRSWTCAMRYALPLRICPRLLSTCVRAVRDPACPKRKTNMPVGAA